jgi:hypothetical protein
MQPSSRMDVIPADRSFRGLGDRCCYVAGSKRNGLPLSSASPAQFSTRTVLIAVALFAVIAAIAATFARRQLAADDLDRVLRGEDDLSVSAFHIEFQQRVVVCTDRSVTQYLTQMMRKSSTFGNGGSGYSYCFAFSFSTGRTYKLYGYISNSQFALSVPSAAPHESGYPTHNIVFEPPIPNRVDEIFTFLNAPWEEVGGLSLHASDDKPLQYTYVPALHGLNPRGSRVDELSRLNQ